MTDAPMFSFHGVLSPGINEWLVDISVLYPSPAARVAFAKRFEGMRSGLPARENEVFGDLDRDVFVFRTESFLPTEAEGPSVLLVLGNPATQSVASGVCFAFEGKQRPHRFWTALDAAGLMRFRGLNDGVPLTDSDRARQLASGTSDTRFRVGIDVALTIPTPASGATWSGVAGLRKLFGAGAFGRVWLAERKRLLETTESFGADCVIAFQKDAYEMLRSPDSPAYDVGVARTGGLVGKTSSGIALWGLPPTRYAHSATFRTLLERIVDQFV